MSTCYGAGVGLYAFVALMAVQAPRVPGPIPIGWAELAFPFALFGIRRIPSLNGAVAAAVAYAAWVALSAWYNGVGARAALGAVELTLVMVVAAQADRTTVLRVWTFAASALCA